MRKKRLRLPKHISDQQVCKMIFTNIPINLRDAFKAYCARRGISMRKRFMELMEADSKTDLLSIKQILKEVK